MRPAKLNPMARHAIARAYHAGVRPCELARDWNVSPSYVLQTARWYDRIQQDRWEKIAAKRTLEFSYEPPKKAVEKRVWSLTSDVGRELGIRAVAETVVNRTRTIRSFNNADAERIPVSLPYVSIQHSRAGD